MDEAVSPFAEMSEHGREQSVVVQAFPCCGLTAADYRKQMLAAACLNGLSGPLFEEVREKHGLAYYSGVRMVAGISSGLFAVVSGCERGKAVFLADRVRAICERVGREGFTDPEWEAGRAQLRAGLRRSRQRVGWRAVRMAVRGVVGLECDLGESDESFLEKIGKDEMIAWCSHHLAANHESTLSFLARETEPNSGRT